MALHYQGRARDSQRNERGFDQFCHGSAAEIPGVCFIKAKMACCGENSSGYTNEQSPQGGASSGDLLDQKSKVPSRYSPGGGGGGGMNTND